METIGMIVVGVFLIIAVGGFLLLRGGAVDDRHDDVAEEEKFGLAAYRSRRYGRRDGVRVARILGPANGGRIFLHVAGHPLGTQVRRRSSLLIP